MPAVALSRVGARVVESGPGGQDLAAGTWPRLEALPDPRSPQGRIYPLACLVAIAICAWRPGSGRPGRKYPDLLCRAGTGLDVEPGTGVAARIGQAQVGVRVHQLPI